MNDQLENQPKVTLTVSCPLPVYLWLKQSQRNVSAYVVEAIESMKSHKDIEGDKQHEDH